ncbi:MAG: energy-coupling factor transporter ATP-binding protein EcfA2 [Arenicella sp.]|jgi:energy-coupling factor transporter ATP-binding protein EcfA2
MYCKKAILVNWGNIPNLDFDFGPVNLFSGGNGSGKTTAADALQSLMTASYENLFNYNPGQDETTQRGRGGKQVRTLASYVLGCDDGSYARTNPTDGYIVAVFHPTKGETGSPFSAVMAVRAALETVGKQRQARQRQLAFYVVSEQELSIEHFVNNGKVTNLDDIGHNLIRDYGKDQVEMYDKKGLYLNRLYGALRGQKGSVSKREAQHAAKTFSNFMAYKPVKSINDFVAKEILEPRDLSEDIKQVSELMKTIHSMESETRQITDVINNLHDTQDLSQRYIEQWLNWRLCDYRELIRLAWVKQREYLNAKTKQQGNTLEQTETQARLNNMADKRSSLHAQLVELEAQRQGIPALKDKDQLEQRIEQNRERLIQQARPLLEQDQRFSQNRVLARRLKDQIGESGLTVELAALERKDFNADLRAVSDSDANTGIDMQTLMTQDLAGIANLEQKLDKLIDLEKSHQALANRLHDGNGNDNDRSIRDALLELVTQRRQKQSRLAEQTNAKKREVLKLENQTVSYPAFVEAALKAISQQCPKARPTVLCDFINISDPAWQMSIEGYLGGSRFCIIVEPDFEAQAARIVRNLPGRRNGAKVIQGWKAQRDASKLSTAAKSILEVMTFEHKIAEYYVKGAYGNVLRVNDEQALRETARGITPDGLGSGGYTIFRCDIDDSELVFGRGARERALRAKQTQLDELQAASYRAEQSARQVAVCLETVDKIKTVHISTVIRTMLELFRSIEVDRFSLEAIDLSDFTNLEQELQHKREQLDSVENQSKELQTNLGRLESDENSLKKKTEDISSEQDKLQEQQEQRELQIESISRIYQEFDAQDELEQAEAQALQHAKSTDTNDDFKSELESYQQHCTVLERQLDKCVLQHNQRCRIEDSIVYMIDTGSDGVLAHNQEWFKRIVLVLKEVNSAINRLQNNILVGKYEKLVNLRDSFNTAFITNLCHSIYQSINDGKRILDELNKELESHRFGTDQERYHFGYEWVAEFQEYQRFFKEVINLPSLGDGSSLFEADLGEKSTQVRDKLLSMLLDNDEQTALRELNRLSDYRHYRAYEIYKTPKGKEPIALSQYGTGSGGQLETPAYIIRSAAVTSAFKFNQGSTHCRMVLVDEAFSKMDEARSREVIHYLTNELGLQLIFIMPTSKSGPFMDLISHQTIFSKCPSASKIGELDTQVLVDRKICNQDKIQQLWAQHRRNIRVQTSLDFMQEFIEV